MDRNWSFSIGNHFSEKRDNGTFNFKTMNVTYRALSLNDMGAKPGGAPMIFWLPEYAASTFHLSIRKGTAPSEATVSTTSKQLYLKMFGMGVQKHFIYFLFN